MRSPLSTATAFKKTITSTDKANKRIPIRAEHPGSHHPYFFQKFVLPSIVIDNMNPYFNNTTMSKSYREKKLQRGKISKNHTPNSIKQSNITEEKMKARTLRNSTWWKRKRSSGTCYYCGRTFKPHQLTMDHIIPLSRGGTSERFNIVPACKECNNTKKYLLPAEWDEYINTIKSTKV
jgi:5-methylcytosine-specific restriction protein A